MANINIAFLMLNKNGPLLHYKEHKSSNRANSSSSTESEGTCEGFKNVAGVLKLMAEEQKNYQFFVIYDENDPEKDKHFELATQAIRKSQKKDIDLSVISINNNVPNCPPPLYHSYVDAELSECQTDQQRIEHIARDTFNSIKRELTFVEELNKKKLQFEKQLSLIKAKAENLDQRGHDAAAKKANELHLRLTELSDGYFENPSRDNYEYFKKEAQEAINNSKSELQNHRGWNHILANIGLAILGFLVLYVAAVAINRGFFFTQTQSEKLVEDVDHLIDTDEYEADLSILAPRR
ncbi:hypothetical protein [Legionella fallonii]|uniref:Effector protein B, substrate of the Dot/Icm secretion system n=1 Tax=Legionella fallonii LLAP-10 TaxID=1212491 RepID=A0A098G4X0_9GAMM|nr:hypothetical protein [Legionella fallonii]CEG57512.1 protein of unknown function [Legionella fallonii LLAP-10]